MNKEIIFKGVGTALITPFKDSKIDYDSLSEIIELQIAAGVSALIIGGTTGEAATLTDAERYKLFDFSRDKTAGRVKLLLGVGTNDTAAAIKHVKAANKCGCDGVLAVTPYYNKGTQNGVLEHYLRLSDCSLLPIMLYNVPSRTGVNLTIEQLMRLCKQENVVAIKEAGDLMDRFTALRAYCPSLALYAGNDSQIFTTLALGGMGVVSVLSNVCPKLANGICNAFFDGEIEKSRNLQLSAIPLIEALFAETNPAPVKYALSRLGLCENSLRLPMAPVSEESSKKVEKAILNPQLSDYLIGR